MTETRRQSLAAALRRGGLTALVIARRFSVPVKTVLADLEHVRRGLRGGERLVIVPAECAACGFAFAERRRLDTPSRCPKCRSEQISEPVFRIEARG